MRRFTLALFTIFLLMPSANAIAPVDLSEKQGSFGGYSLDISANNATSSAGGLIENAPTIVEVYTATWCTNCVDSEHSLMDSIASFESSSSEFNHSTTVLTHHRFISESEDPFGSQEGDDRWNERYGDASKEATGGLQRAPPTVAFHGNMVRVGSVAEGESLEADYSELLESRLEVNEQQQSIFTWSGNNSSGTLTWSLSTSGTSGGPTSDDYKTNITHRIMVVEHSAYFPEGSNGLEYYDDSVRAVYTLGTDPFGQINLDLPPAWDGDDLSLVLIHDWTSTPVEDAEGDEDEGLLLGFLAPLALIGLGAAAIIRRD
ncbi:MAG: hypothetical protein QF440_01135 [Candidatus Thalassarchaeaceae archaeon]|jgi:hypothetical protein|nr:hypothetical protein [Candidatus Thalassarchaeaceae archaeon]